MYLGKLGKIPAAEVLIPLKIIRAFPNSWER